MKTMLRRTLPVALGAALLVSPAAAQQPKETIGSVREALATSSILSGRSGPASVNWIESGNRFSYSAVNPENQREEVRVLDPAGADVPDPVGMSQGVYTETSQRLRGLIARRLEELRS